MTLTLLGTLVVLALVDSTSVGTLFIPIWLLMTPGPLQLRRFSVYLGTVVGFYFVVGVALAFGARALLGPISDAVDAVTDATGSQVWRVLQLALGAALFAWSFRIARTGKESGPGRILEWRDKAMAGDGHTRPLMTLALTATAIELGTMLPYLGAIAAMTAADLSIPLLLATLAAYCLVMVLPAVVLVGARLLARRAVEPLLGRISAWMERNAGEAASWVVGLLGFWVAANAIGQLTER